MINCIFEDGGKGSLRHVVTDAIIIKENKILLAKRASHITNPNKYCLPGGFLNRDETITECMKREIMEETGYEAKELNLFRIIDNPNRKREDRQNVSFVFLVEPGNQISTPDSEVKKLEWFGLDNLPKEEDFAFDHFENVKLYLKHLTTPFSLPIFTS